jgi:excisionase family DNA binding protein
MDALLTIEQAARELAVQERTVRNLVYGLRLRPARGTGRQLLFSIDEITRYKQAREHNSRRSESLQPTEAWRPCSSG